MNNRKMYSSWEVGTTNDNNTIYIGLKGRTDCRFSHFHISVEEATDLAKDILKILYDNRTGIKTKIKHNIEVD